MKKHVVILGPGFAGLELAAGYVSQSQPSVASR
jgi:NADH dehydrogenase FAD-containing subunit